MPDNSQPLMGSVKYSDSLDFRQVLNDSLNVFFKDAWRVALSNPAQAYHFLRTLRWQRRAAKVRSRCGEQGVHVPPMLIFSITNRCNLHCQGCYNWAMRPAAKPEMDAAKLQSVIAEAKELGIAFIMIAGGEPLIRPEILDITRAFPEITFLVFTNGLLLTAEVVGLLEKQHNFVPVLSLEGHEAHTDARRGQGVYQQLRSAIEKLKNRGIFWGVSFTVTRLNLTVVTDEEFIQELVSQGCKLVFFVEYTPVDAETEAWLLTDEQRRQLLSFRNACRARYPALFVAIPGDEEEIGGCLSAGRGFIHISAAGDVEPCPFVPYSDANLKDMSLKEALQSSFLKAIRDNHSHLSEAGGCALWVERQWVQSLLPENNNADISQKALTGDNKTLA